MQITQLIIENKLQTKTSLRIKPGTVHEYNVPDNTDKLVPFSVSFSSLFFKS